MELPDDPMMLFSMVNMKLRDCYHSLDELCDDMNVDIVTGERLDLVSLDDYLKGKTSIDGGSGSEGGGSDSDGDQGENPLG